MNKLVAELTDEELEVAKAETRRLSRLARVIGIYDAGILQNVKQMVLEDACD